MDFQMFLSVVQAIFGLIIVIVLANISLKFANKHMMKHKSIIRVVEKVGVNNNSALSIVNICDEYYLMSFTGSDNKILKELDKEQVETFMTEMGLDLAAETNIDMNIGSVREKVNNYFGMRKKS